MEFQTTMKNDGIYEGTKYDSVSANKWKDMLVPVEMRDTDGDQDGVKGLKLDLDTLLKVLDQHSSGNEDGGHSTWQLVVIQAILLSILVLVAIAWACCCKKNCVKSDESPRVQAALRKLSSNASIKSRDFPPSYSQADLYTLAMSVQDYLYPPPDYPDVFNRTADDLAYLDLEGGHRRLSKLSFSSPGSTSGVTPGTTPYSQRSHSSQQDIQVQPGQTSSAILQGLPGVNHQHLGLSRQSTWSLNSSSAPLSRQSTWSSTSSLDSRKSSLNRESVSHSRKSSLEDPSSRKSSMASESRKGSHSRISFNESVECSNGSHRRLSGPQEDPSLSRQSSSSSLPQPQLSRQSSISSLAGHSGHGESARKSTLLASRKLGLSQESLNEALMKKLEAIEQEEIIEDFAQAEPVNNDGIISMEIDQSRTGLETVIEIEDH